MKEELDLDLETLQQLSALQSTLQCKNFREFRKRFDLIYKKGLNIQNSYEIFQ